MHGKINYQNNSQYFCLFISQKEDSTKLSGFVNLSYLSIYQIPEEYYQISLIQIFSPILEGYCILYVYL